VHLPVVRVVSMCAGSEGGREGREGAREGREGGDGEAVHHMVTPCYLPPYSLGASASLDFHPFQPCQPHTRITWRHPDEDSK
jgi:hypothetical protein